MTEDEELRPTVACAACRAANPRDAGFCTSCGAKLEAGPPELLPAGKRRGRRPAGDAVEQSRARHEFGRIKNIVLTVRSVFWACAVFAFVQALLWHTVLAGALEGPSARWHTAITVLVWGQLGLTVAGALLVLRAPLAWTTVGACFWTLNTAVALWANGFTQPIGALCQSFLLVAFWFAVAQAARVQKLMAADPKLQIVRQRIDPSRRVVGGVADEARERRRAERHKLLQRLGAGVGLLVVAGVVIFLLTRPPGVDATIASFTERWGRSDVEAIGDLFVDGRTDRAAAALREDVERRGWQRALPRLGEAKVDGGEDAAKATYSCGAGEVHATFGRGDSGWHLTRVTVPPLEAGDLAPAVESFRTAWAANGSESLVSLWRPASRERFGGAMQRMLEKRGWHEQRPALGDVGPKRADHGRARVTFPLDGDELAVTYEYWHPQWFVVGVALPQR